MRQSKSDLEKGLHSKILLGLAGDTASYAEFLQEIANLLRIFLMKKMGSKTRSKERAEELVQEVLLAIHQKRHLYRTSDPILPWVYAIANYRLIDSIRAESRRPNCVPWTDEYDQIFSVVAEDANDIFADKVEDLLQGLPALQRKVLKMAKVDEIPLAKIAEQLALSISAVKVNIHRSIKALRKNESKKEVIR